MFSITVFPRGFNFGASAHRSLNFISQRATFFRDPATRPEDTRPTRINARTENEC